MKYTAPKGTRDLLPGETEKWVHIEAVVRGVFARYGFSEIRTPIFEQTELFVRGIGEVTDIVEKEMYTFVDKGGRSMTLRPEGTASVARAYIEHKMFSQAQPVKLYYMGPMFRYERPQAGRYRQLHQFGVEAFGSRDPAIDAEVIGLALNLYHDLGLTEIQTSINSIGCQACRHIYKDALHRALEKHLSDLCDNCRSRYDRNPLRILDCKLEGCKRMTEAVPPIFDYLCDECRSHFEGVKRYLNEVGVPFVVDPCIVRGLDYYTKTVFEFRIGGIGAQDAIGAGGRYDGLIESCGGPPTPGVGFAAGLDRVLLAMELQGVVPQTRTPLACYIAAIGESSRQAAFRLLFALRRAGLVAEMDYMDRGLKAQMKQADRMGAAFVVMIGEDELRSGLVVVRDMARGTQESVPIGEVVRSLSAKPTIRP